MFSPAREPCLPLPKDSFSNGPRIGQALSYMIFAKTKVGEWVVL